MKIQDLAYFVSIEQQEKRKRKIKAKLKKMAIDYVKMAYGIDARFANEQFVNKYSAKNYTIVK